MLALHFQKDRAQEGANAEGDRRHNLQAGVYRGEGERGDLLCVAPFQHPCGGVGLNETM